MMVQVMFGENIEGKEVGRWTSTCHSATLSASSDISIIVVTLLGALGAFRSYQAKII